MAWLLALLAVWPIGMVIAGWVCIAKRRRAAATMAFVGVATPMLMLVVGWWYCFETCAGSDYPGACEDASSWCFLATIAVAVVTAVVWVPLGIAGLVGALRHALPGSWWDRRWPSTPQAEDAQHTSERIGER